MTVIVDYGMGNLESVKNAIFFLEKKAIVTSCSQEISKAKKIIFPGVGHFAKAVDELNSRKLLKPLKDKIKSGTPFLGICLGMQLLFEKSSEAAGVPGLGVIKGEVLRFNRKDLIVPHMGWNQVKKTQNPNVKFQINDKIQNQDKKMDLFAGIEDQSYFYFAHSYFCKPQEEVALTTTNYGGDFASAICKENVWAIQFHPEKSQAKGLKVLDNFLTHDFGHRTLDLGL